MLRVYRHGLEDVEDYQASEAAVTADYDAEAAVERELVLRLAGALWRLRRTTGIEAALFESVTTAPGRDNFGRSRLSLVVAADLPQQNQLHQVAAGQLVAAAASECGLGSKGDIVDSFLRLTALPTFPLDRLSRYEYMLWRQARQLVFTLETLRRRKRTPSRSSFPFSFRRREPSTVSDESR